MIKQLSIVILNWNGFDDTRELLRDISHLKTNNLKVEVIVVDNGSSDGSSQKLSKIVLPNMEYKLLLNKGNLGFAGGNNVGIDYTLEREADYVVILNNDTRVDSDLLIHLTKLAQSDDKIGAVSPKIYFAKGFEFHKDRYIKENHGKVLWYAGGEIDWKNVYGKTRGVDEVDIGQYDKTVKTDFVTGTCMLLTKEVLEKVGKFDERFFLYYEDTDLSIRIRQAGYKTMFLPQAVIWHKVARSSGIGSELNDYYTTRNRMLFGIKYASVHSKLALFRESIKLLFKGRKWQKIGIKDYYLGNFGKGSFQSTK